MNMVAWLDSDGRIRRKDATPDSDYVGLSYDELMERVWELQKSAERYHWLRRQLISPREGEPNLATAGQTDVGFDEAIDRAMKEAG